METGLANFLEQHLHPTVSQSLCARAEVSHPARGELYMYAYFTLVRYPSAGGDPPPARR